MFWSTLGRMIVVPVAFITATVAAIFVLVTLGSERIVHAISGTNGIDGFEALFDLFSHGVLLASGLTILPALALVIVGEVARIRSGLYYVLGGGAALAAIWCSAARAPRNMPCAARGRRTWRLPRRAVGSPRPLRQPSPPAPMNCATARGGGSMR